MPVSFGTWRFESSHPHPWFERPGTSGRSAFRGRVGDGRAPADTIVYDTIIDVSISGVSKEFVGRRWHLDKLHADLDEVRATGTARFVVVRGRRRVGKSRLVQQFVTDAHVPHVFFQASQQAPAAELALFTEEIARSDLLVAEHVRSGTRFESWEAALALIAGQATAEQPAVIVIDEFPYLAERDSTIEAQFQKLYDRHLDARAPVMLIVVGSDLRMMERLHAYDRPLHGRPTRTLVVDPFAPSEVADLLGMTATDTLDAYLIAGGFPLVSRSWSRGTSARRFLHDALGDPTAPLIVDGERMLTAEFPRDVQARDVLGAIGAGDRTFTNIGRRAGIPATSLKRSLEILIDGKGVVVARRPLSRTPSKETRYAIADPYLRFWLRFIEPHLGRIERGQGALVADEIWAQWESYRGVAIEPIVREALSRLLGSDPRVAPAEQIGGWWNRANSVEVDLVGAGRGDVPKRIDWVGSIKWRGRKQFTREDTAALIAAQRHVAGAEQARLVGVSRAGFADAGLDAVFAPEDLVAAW